MFTYQPVCMVWRASPLRNSAKECQTTSRKGEPKMTSIGVSRRNLLATGACALAGAVSLPGAASASAWEEQNSANEEVVRRWYAAWDTKDWGPVDSLLADNFTFSSAAGDDHISKST